MAICGRRYPVLIWQKLPFTCVTISSSDGDPAARANHYHKFSRVLLLISVVRRLSIVQKHRLWSLQYALCCLVYYVFELSRPLNAKLSL